MVLGRLSAYYQRHLALVDGVAHGWVGCATPVALRPGVRQVGATRDRDLVLTQAGELIALPNAPILEADMLMAGVAWFHAGHSGWAAIDGQGVLWRGAHGDPDPKPVGQGVTWAWIGDGADYFIDEGARLHVTGLAHRGQYGDGRLASSSGFVVTAEDALQVVAHTGHALYLRRDGAVLGTGGNRFGPLSWHGLGDKADRWGLVFENAARIATGARHSVALRADASLWAWGQGLAIAPRQLAQGIVDVAAGETTTLAWTHDGRLLQWDHGHPDQGAQPLVHAGVGRPRG